LDQFLFTCGSAMIGGAVLIGPGDPQLLHIGSEPPHSCHFRE
jgi:hypothetical protein